MRVCGVAMIAERSADVGIGLYTCACGGFCSGGDAGV